MSNTPQVPTPAHILADSMLSRHFGKETVNYFSSSPLNRLSFLRSEHPFLSAALKHPSTRFVLLKDLAPLTRSPAELYYAKYNEVRKLVPEDVYDRPEEDMIKEFDSRKTSAQLIFLGLDESRKQDGLAWKIYNGTPYFALDVTPKGSQEHQSHAKDIISSLEAQGLSFYQSRVVMSLPADEAAIYAQSRALVDWNTRNTFCGTCGHPTLSVNSGTKRACPPTDAALVEAGKERPGCNTRTTLSNLSFPRTDPTIIVAVLSADAKRILLGRSKRFPSNLYSTLAGFIEPAESVEDAVRREVWEEAGVTLSRVVIHSSQPWPYPANLMIGAIAQVSDPEHEKISLLHDPELEDAKWFEVDEVEEALRIGTGPLGEQAGPEYKGGLRLPPPTAIANQLIQAAITGDYITSQKSKM
ncbi:NAD(+) diphosphatase [Aspergillus clavatus NRRL 1]|uniref:NAD(+) diphosphatase n=1 Tax=Aspergillus clavatus (strain ATCC 1007 / CBS 513.65 / DSM 816 / NCTC 3887 / NRRL 1 / QM 1276 / 107) TaxID=344612 RepID=A1C502_ASPCL|nr:NADH pyrophosphatase, putative [Aspergillus clavatus NRRL 1]EAW14770.1 NADH pyrophosphatase, putative [Aspergillus clavatus NRRL 1]